MTLTVWPAAMFKLPVSVDSVIVGGSVSASGTIMLSETEAPAFRLCLATDDEKVRDQVRLGGRLIGD